MSACASNEEIDPSVYEPPEQKKASVVPKIFMAAVLALIAYFTIYVLLPSGILNAGILSLPSCNPAYLFLCKNPSLSASGKINMDLGQAVGITMYNAELACEGNPAPNRGSGLNYMALDIAASGLQNNTLQNGEVVSVNNLQCYTGNGKPFGLGLPFNGTILVNYTLHPGPPSSYNSWSNVKAASVSLRAS
jgi:hypothetical protein